MRRLLAVVVAGVTLLVGLVAVASGALAQDASGNDAGGATTSGPTLSVSNSAPQPGDRVDVIFTDWDARYATLSVCGNLAKRGSADCNMVQSTGVRLFTSSGDFSPVHGIVVPAPPTDCPCVIRAVGGDNGEVAVVPIELIGHPISPVSAPDLGQPVVNVGLKVAGASDGLLSSLKESLGGETAMVATVTVTNLTTEPVTSVAVHGRARRRGVTAAEFDLVPGPIGPGQTWTGTAEVSLPAPAMGEYEWEATASGAGPVMTADVVTRQLPWLFVLFLLAFAGLISAVLVRAFQRRADERRALPVASRIDPEKVIDIASQDGPPDGPASGGLGSATATGPFPWLPPPPDSAAASDPTLVGSSTR